VGDDPSGSRDGAGKSRVSLLLEQSTVARLQSLGPDWQERLNEILRQALENEEL
jgi:uncharacterized protein (DUF4415 family)